MRSDIASILIAMGFDSNTDFSATDPGDGDVRVDWYAATSMPTTAEIDAAAPQVMQLTATRAAKAAKAAASATVDKGDDIAGDYVARLMWAFAMVLLGELNRRALKLNAILDAVDAASSLAALKTGVSLIADENPITSTQLLNAIKAQIAATVE